VLLKQGRTREALPFLESAVRLDPAIADAQYQLGKALVDEGRLAEAERPLNRAVSNEAPLQTRMSAEYQLALLLTKLGRTQEAARHRQVFHDLQKQFLARQAK
jgi:tetratricopeptide (TPR) repeat protein